MFTIATRADVLARFGKALADPTRCQLLLALRNRSAYPAELAEALGLSRTNISNHLTCLRGCGLVVAVPEGRRQRYELADARLAHALDDLLETVVAVDPEEPCMDEHGQSGRPRPPHRPAQSGEYDPSTARQKAGR